MGLLSKISKLWKKKNQLRAKISPVARSIDKDLGLDKVYDLPGMQFKVEPDPSFNFSEDVQNVLRLGNATVNAGGYRAQSPNSVANGRQFYGSVLADTLTAQQQSPVGSPGAVSPLTPQPQVGYPTLGPPQIVTPRTPAFGLSSIGAANVASRRPYTL